MYETTVRPFNGNMPTGDEWHDLVSIAEPRGDDGADGKGGVDGKNGADGINGKDGAERPVGIKVYKEAESGGLVFA